MLFLGIIIVAIMEEKASVKKADNYIPTSGILSASDLERAAQQRKHTDSIVQQSLDQETTAIVAEDTVALVSSF